MNHKIRIIEEWFEHDWVSSKTGPKQKMIKYARLSDGKIVASTADYEICYKRGQHG